MSQVPKGGLQSDHSYNDGMVRGDTRSFGSFVYPSPDSKSTDGKDTGPNATNSMGSVGGTKSDPMFENSPYEQQGGSGARPAEDAADAAEDKGDK